MSLDIEDYALIGDCHTAALVGRNGSIDWACFPCFDSGACFAALLGTPEHGRWMIAPVGVSQCTRRRYRDGTMILETEFENEQGTVRIIDYMPLSSPRRDIVRIVEGIDGTVTMRMELVVRFDYGSIVPWVRRDGDTLVATAGPDTLELHTPISTQGKNMTTVAEFTVAAGQRIPFVLNYHPSYEPAPAKIDTEHALSLTEREWRHWSGRSTYQGAWRDAVMRSLLVLKALTYTPSGGIIAAPTTSLPEQAGGKRNWDYRFCWLRDATFTLNALLLAGYQEEAVTWREWLLRAVAGKPEDLQILYSIRGSRRLEETELKWLPGYGNAKPVRIGNAAATQFQLDVYGEVMDMLHHAYNAGLAPEPHAWRLQIVLLTFLEANWEKPDEGIWEIRGTRRHFTHSKVMAWVAFDRAVKAVECFGQEGPVERWREIRNAIHAQVCESGFDTQRNTFVQSYETKRLDASLLLIPIVGFLPPDDPRVYGTVSAIEDDLTVDGLVLRYRTEESFDGLPSGEGFFLPCSFWLAQNFALVGQQAKAEALFERLLTLCNDLGLMSEEYDLATQKMLGNFPQALTHMALINTAHVLSQSAKETRRPSSGPGNGLCSIGDDGDCAVSTDKP
jgi:GH15 family glucan-1,4-alpha-glucosidase